MRLPVTTDLLAHNDRQRAYYDGTRKKTMVPAETPYVRRHIDAVVRFAELRPGERVLDVGCGMGKFTLPMRRDGFDVEGLDISPWLLEQLEQSRAEQALPAVPLFCEDVATPPESLQGRYDAVVGFFALHHMHDLARCFAGMAAMLKPGGRLVFAEPNPLNPGYYLQVAITPGMKWAAERGILNMRPDTLRAAIESAGLAGFGFARYGFFPPALANRRWGARLEAGLEAIGAVTPVRAFQLFRAERPPRANGGSSDPA